MGDGCNLRVGCSDRCHTTPRAPELDRHPLPGSSLTSRVAWGFLCRVQLLHPAQKLPGHARSEGAPRQRVSVQFGIPGGGVASVTATRSDGSASESLRSCFTSWSSWSFEDEAVLNDMACYRHGLPARTGPEVLKLLFLKVGPGFRQFLGSRRPSSSSKPISAGGGLRPLLR